jgi:hypothetical protein
MKIKFYFNIKNLKYEYFHVKLSRFYKIASTCKKCSILLNWLEVDEILNVFYFQVMKALKNTCVKVDLNTKLTQSSSNIFLTLFMIPKIFKFCIQLTIN